MSMKKRQGVRVKQTNDYTTVWISANVTYRWASGEYGTGRWPLSRLGGKRLRAEFDSYGNLVDYAINGRYPTYDASVEEFNALMEWAIGTSRPTSRDAGQEEVA
ncbi:MAG: hypothetical protein WC965_01145 [Thiohalomonadaceae bacterium]